MKILIYGINFSPELVGIGKYSGEMASWLSKNGHEVRVIAAPPYYPSWEVRKDYKCWSYRKETLSGSRVWRCPTYVPRRITCIKRVIHLASFALTSLPILLLQLLWKPDLVFCVEPPFFCAPAGLLLARGAGATAWMHVQDFEVDAAIDLGMLRFGALKNLILRTEQWFLRRFDVVSTISLSMMKVLESKGVKACNTVLFPNWSDLGNVSKSEASGREFRLLHGISESDFLVLYSGNMGQKQGLSLVIEAAQLLSKEHNICFLLCGDGADRGALEVMVDDMSLTNVLFLPLQPLELFTKMLNAANLHLIIQRAGAADLVMPSKLTNIIGSGGYSLVTADKDTELGMLLERNQYLGTLVESENLEVFTSTLKSLASNEIAIDHKLIRLFALENFEMDSVLTEFELEFVERVNMNSSH